MTFDDMIEFIIDRIEGGYANDPRDNGGETNWGLSVKANPELAGRMKNLTKAEAKAIYRKKYFTPAGISKYPVKARLVVFDGVINHGIVGNNKLVQKALNSMRARLVVDGVVGPKTMAAIKAADPLDFLTAYCRQRLAFYRSHPDYNFAGASWEKRLFLTCLAS